MQLQLIRNSPYTTIPLRLLSPWVVPISSFIVKCLTLVLTTPSLSFPHLLHKAHPKNAVLFQVSWWPNKPKRICSVFIVSFFYVYILFNSFYWWKCWYFDSSLQAIMHTKYQRDWQLGSALKFDHKFSSGNPDKKEN